LGRLVATSLVQAEHQGEVMRYRLLEMVRQYAAEKLAASGESAVWQGRHAEYFSILAEDALPMVTTGERSDWVDLLAAEQDNMRVTLHRLIAQGASDESVRLAGALWRFWRWQQHYREGRRWLEGALALRPAASDAARARALEALGDVARSQGDFAAARAALEESCTLFRALGDWASYARALQNLGIIALDHEVPPDYVRAAALFEECLALRHTLNDERGSIVALNSLGATAVERGDLAQAWGYFEDVLSRARTLESQRMVAIAHVNFGIVGLLQGDDARSRTHIAEALGQVVLPEDSLVVAYGLAVLAGLVSHTGRPTEAARLSGASEGICTAIGFAMPATHRARFDRQIVRGQLDEAAWQAAWATGIGLPVEQALTLARAHLG
jgi:tetratricopeptide (TPR) repeat protein